MATESVHPEVPPSAAVALPAKPLFWKQEDWQAREEVPQRARAYLAQIDRNLYVCMNLASLLVDNDNAVNAAAGNDGIPARPIPFDQRAAVLIAMQDLLSTSSDMSDDLRNDAKIWGEGA